MHDEQLHCYNLGKQCVVPKATMFVELFCNQSAYGSRHGSTLIHHKYQGMLPKVKHTPIRTLTHRFAACVDMGIPEASNT